MAQNQLIQVCFRNPTGTGGKRLKKRSRYALPQPCRGLWIDRLPCSRTTSLMRGYYCFFGHRLTISAGYRSSASNARADFLIQQAILSQLLDKISNPPTGHLNMIRQGFRPALHTDKRSGALAQLQEPFVLEFRDAFATVFGLTTRSSASARIPGNCSPSRNPPVSAACRICCINCT